MPATAMACFALTTAAAEEGFPNLTKRLQAEKPAFAASMIHRRICAMTAC
jgi:hypothetical protein